MTSKGPISIRSLLEFFFLSGTILSDSRTIPSLRSFCLVPLGCFSQLPRHAAVGADCHKHVVHRERVISNAGLIAQARMTAIARELNGPLPDRVFGIDLSTSRGGGRGRDSPNIFHSKTAVCAPIHRIPAFTPPILHWSQYPFSCSSFWKDAHSTFVAHNNCSPRHLLLMVESPGFSRYQVRVKWHSTPGSCKRASIFGS